MLDTIIIIIFIYSFINGFLKGAIKEIIEIIALLVAAPLSSWLYNFLINNFEMPEIIQDKIVGTGLIIILIIIAAKLLIVFFNSIAKTLFLDGLNKFIGSFVSFLKWLVIISYSIIVIEHFEIISKEKTDKSRFYNKILEYKVTQKIKQYLPGVKEMTDEIINTLPEGEIKENLFKQENSVDKKSRDSL